MLNAEKDPALIKIILPLKECNVTQAYLSVSEAYRKNDFKLYVPSSSSFNLSSLLRYLDPSAPLPQHDLSSSTFHCFVDWKLHSRLDWFETENVTEKYLHFTFALIKLLKWKIELLRKVSFSEFIGQLHQDIVRSPGMRYWNRTLLICRNIASIEPSLQGRNLLDTIRIGQQHDELLLAD